MSISLSEYEKVCDLAVSTAKLKTREDVKRSAWLPFTLLYDQMVKRKEIEPINNLSEETRRKYWNETKGISFVTTERFKRIIVSRALYMYDTIMKDL